MNPFGIPWGARVRAAQSPEGVMLTGHEGVLCEPSALDLNKAIPGEIVALFKVDTVHWVVRSEGWEFEVADQSAEDDWMRFVERCRSDVHKIRSTGDDGHYAKLYAEDVSRLLGRIAR